MKINDGRIGSLDAKGMVEKYPTHYATGGFWNRSANATPSTCYFGKANNYFFVLPILVPAISEKLWDEFYTLIEEERPIPEVVVRQKVLPVVEPERIIGGETDNAPAIIKPKGTKKKQVVSDNSYLEDTSRPEDDSPNVDAYEMAQIFGDIDDTENEKTSATEDTNTNDNN